jgi:cell division protein FtsL
MRRKKIDRTAKLIKFEKKVAILGAVLLFTIWGVSFFAKNKLSSINIEVERLSRQVKDQKEVNQSLNMKINELASLENINKVASNVGLTYNNNNIRIVIGE